MNKKDMVKFLTKNYLIWEDVRLAITYHKSLNGWYANYNGNHINDFYISNCNPMGDESGESIYIDDFLNHKIKLLTDILSDIDKYLVFDKCYQNSPIQEIVTTLLNKK